MTDKADKAKQTTEVVQEVQEVVKEVQAPVQEAQKTWPDVADKTVDKISDMVVNIRDTLQEQAPQVWEGLVDFHRTKAISELIVDVLIILISISVIFTARYLIEKGQVREKIYDQERDSYNKRVELRKEQLREEGKSTTYAHQDVQSNCADDGSAYQVGGWILLVASTVFILIRLTFLPDPIAEALVPERAAAHEIINSVR